MAKCTSALEYCLPLFKQLGGGGHGHTDSVPTFNFGDEMSFLSPLVAHLHPPQSRLQPGNPVVRPTSAASHRGRHMVHTGHRPSWRDPSDFPTVLPRLMPVGFRPPRPSCLRIHVGQTVTWQLHSSKQTPMHLMRTTVNGWVTAGCPAVNGGP